MAFNYYDLDGVYSGWCSTAFFNYPQVMKLEQTPYHKASEVIVVASGTSGTSGSGGTTIVVGGSYTWIG